MMAELIDAFDAADADDDVRAIIVTGAGRAFCAGADLSAGAKTFDYAARATGPSAGSRAADGELDWSHDAVRDGGGRVTLRIFECLKPVIAAVNGAAVGVGVTMQLPMDIRIASRRRALRLRVRAARHRARGLLELVPAARGRHRAGAGVEPIRAASSTPRRRWPAAWSASRARARRVAAAGTRARARDRRQHRAGVGCADAADDVAAARRRPSDGSAQARQPRRSIRAALSADAQRGRHVVPREAAAAVRMQGVDRHAGVFSVVERTTLRLRSSRRYSL